MTPIARLACYVALVTGLSYGLVSGAMWLARPDPSIRTEARVAPIPPRIAASIERKREALPEAEPVRASAAAELAALTSVPLPMVRPDPEAPAMKEASASLQTVPFPPVRRDARARHAAPPLALQPDTPAEPPVARDEAPRPAVRISTARSDFPY